MHFGKITFDVDQRGEVANLTRNIKIQASEDAAQTYFGGHIMAMVTSKMFIEGVEVSRMGQHMELARYPIPVSYTHLRAHETKANLVCRLP